MKRFMTVSGLVLICALAGAQGTDLCAVATIIPVPGVYPGTNVGATASTAGTVGTCSTTGLDVWFSYTTTAAVSSRVIASCCPPGSSSFSVNVDMFLGPCGAFTTSICSVAWCQQNPLTPAITNGRALSASLPTATTVFIRVRGTTSTTTGTFMLYVDELSDAPPTNGTCAGAIPVVDGTNSGLSNINEPIPLEPGFAAGTVATTGVRDVFYTYMASGNGNTTVGTCLPATGPVPATHIRDSQIRIYADCMGGTPLAGDDDSCLGGSSQGGFLSTLSFCTAMGTTYVIKVTSFGTTSGNEGTFDLVITPPLPPPSNDDCSSPIAIFDGENGPFTNENACTSGTFITPATCAAGGAGRPGFNDVFFTYTANCPGTIDMTTCNPPGFTGTNVDTQLVVHEPGCPVPGSVVGCNDDQAVTCPGGATFQSTILGMPVTQGTTYLVRVAGWDNLTGGLGGVGTFKITITPHPAASKSQIAPGCSDGGGPGPTLDLDAAPVSGSVRTLSITGAAGTGVGVLFISGGPAAPTALTGGCSWNLQQGTQSFLSFIMTDGSGSWSITGTVPVGIDCTRIWVQGFVFPTSGTPFYQVTSTLEVVPGP
jgi:hypothetical protein